LIAEAEYTALLLELKYRYPLINFTQVKVLQSDVYLSKVLKYFTFSKYCITTATFMYRNVLHL